MHVLIDGLSARVGGGITQLQGLLHALPQVAPQHHYSVLLSPLYQASLINSLPDQIFLVSVNVHGADLIGRTWFQNVALPKIVRELHVDVLHVSGEGAYFHCPVPTVMLSGNLSLFSAPVDLDASQLGFAVYRLLRRPFVWRAMHVVDHVAFVSNYMRTLALKVIGLPIEKTFIMYHGISSQFYSRNLDRAGDQANYNTQPYFLSVSSINPHKGYETLLEAYAWLPRDKSTPPLLIAGAVLHKPTYVRMQAIIQREQLKEKVRFLGSVAYDRLPDLYRRASIFVLPSHLESFGLPLLEAMASGVPIVTSDLPICHEICEDSALYFQPGDAVDLAHHLQTLMQNQSMGQELSRRAQLRAQSFTWKKTASTLVSKLENLTASKV